MLRRIVGWIAYTDETWEEIGHRMKDRLQQSLTRYPIRDWSATLKRRKEVLKLKYEGLPYWTKCAMKWDPRTTPGNLQVTHRLVGRPPKRWDDLI